MAVLEFSKLIDHNIQLKKEGQGPLNHLDVLDTIKAELPNFAKTVQELRSGRAVDSKGRKTKPVDLSFEKAVEMFYKVDVKTFLDQLGINTRSMTLSDACESLGCTTLNKVSFENMMTDHSIGLDFSNVSSTGNTNQILGDHRFIIPELIISAIRTGYIHSALHTNWIATTQPISTKEITMPQIKRGDGTMTKIAEGADIPMGSVSFGQKRADVFKVGTGFSISDELLYQSSMDILFIYLQEVGNDLAISSDIVALDVLLNGEQANGSESAPVIGVETVGTFAYKDLKRAFTRGKRLSQPYTRIIAGEDDGIDITSIDKFEGFNGGQKIASINSILGVPETFDIDTHVPPADQIVFVSPTRALAKLSYKGLMIERQRNPRNQTEELYITDFLGFAIIKRDARLVVDKSIAFSTNGFPAYMDIDARITEGFKEV